MSTQQSVQGATPPPPGIVPNFEKPEDVLHTVNLVSQVLAVALITPIVGLRLWTRWRIAPPFLIDDWFCLVAFILSILYSCTAFTMNKFGGGFHSWEISAGDFENYLKALYADTLVYGPNAWFVKVTLLLVVIRVFSINRTFVIFWYAFIAAMTGYYVPVLFIKMNICQPIRGYWDPSVPSHCLDQRAVFVADTVVSAVTDLAVLLAPVPVIRAIKMSFTQKIRVYLLLGAGGVATVASFIRMYLVIQLQQSNDQTVDFVRFNLLGTAEVAIGLACACMPTINQLYQSRNRSDQRNRPRSRANRSPKFIKRSNDKRHWWTDGFTSTQNTIATPGTNYGTELSSVPIPPQKLSARQDVQGQYAPAHPSAPPSSVPRKTAQVSSRHLSTRSASISTLLAGSFESQDRNPPIKLWIGAPQPHGNDMSYSSGPLEHDEDPSSPGWPFPRTASRLPDMARTASREPLYDYARCAVIEPSDVEAAAMTHVELDEVQAIQGPKYDC